MQRRVIPLIRTTAAALAVVVLSTAAQAQGRLSLGERVARLEAQSQGGGDTQNSVELLNRINEMQAELANLRNLVEQQTF